MFAEHHGPGLGRAIGIDDRGIGKRFADGTHQAFADRRRAHADALDGGNIRLLEARLAQHHRDHRRNGSEPSAVKSLDGIDIRAGIELRQQNDGSMGGHCQLGQGQRVHVKHGCSDQKHMVRKVVAGQARIHDPQMALMRKNHAFGHAG